MALGAALSAVDGMGGVIAMGSEVENQDTSPQLVPRIMFERHASNAKYSVIHSFIMLDSNQKCWYCSRFVSASINLSSRLINNSDI